MINQLEIPKYIFTYKDGKPMMAISETGRLINTTRKKILYIDLDGPCADYDKAKVIKNPAYPLFFLRLEIVDGALEAVTQLNELFDIYFLSTAPWSNPSSWMEKRLWVEEKFGKFAKKRLILSHNKGLLRGDFLIDDRLVNGVTEFNGEHIHFGTKQYPNWNVIIEYLKTKI